MFRKIIIFLLLIISVNGQINCADNSISSKAKNFAFGVSGVLSLAQSVIKYSNKTIIPYGMFDLFNAGISFAALIRNLDHSQYADIYEGCIKKHLNPSIYISIFALLKGAASIVFKDTMPFDSADLYSSGIMLLLMGTSWGVDLIEKIRNQSQSSEVTVSV